MRDFTKIFSKLVLVCYVTSSWNVSSGGKIFKANRNIFVKNDETSTSLCNVPYDYGSVMHYSRLAFSQNGRETITVKSGAAIGQRVGMSDPDWKKINNMYCPNTLGIRIRNAGDLLYLQGAGPSREGVAVISATFQREEHQLWTVQWANLQTQVGSTLVPWSQDVGLVKYMDENTSSNVLIRSYSSLIAKQMWMIKPVNQSGNPYQIVNVDSKLCLYSRGATKR